MFRFQWPKHWLTSFLSGSALIICLSPIEAFAQTISDLLIVMESDGRTHTVQHTLAATENSVNLKLPGSVIPQQIRFMGPDAVANQLNYQEAPDTISINNGSVFARYRHQYGEQIIERTGKFTLSTPSIPASISVESGTLKESSITWVFPRELEIISYTAINNDTGKWISENNTLSYFQHVLGTVTLSIEFRNSKRAASAKTASKGGTLSKAVTAFENRCRTDTNNDQCSPDTDKDGVPDYRDVCKQSVVKTVNALGCNPNSDIVLRDIVFPSGHNYLDMPARRALDTVAYALRHTENQYFEIGAHTDNVGSAANNKKLSQKRADAVRHYLLLRGVMPNYIRSNGYGENYPIKDNSDAAGKRANRRIELTLIKQ